MKIGFKGVKITDFQRAALRKVLCEEIIATGSGIFWTNALQARVIKLTEKLFRMSSTFPPSLVRNGCVWDGQSESSCWWVYIHSAPMEYNGSSLVGSQSCLSSSGGPLLVFTGLQKVYTSPFSHYLGIWLIGTGICGPWTASINLCEKHGSLLAVQTSVYWFGHLSSTDICLLIAFLADQYSPPKKH